MMKQTHRRILAALLALCGAAGLRADPAPLLHVGFPSDTPLYAEVDLAQGYSDLFDLDRWEAAGVRGWSFDDLAATLDKIGVKVTGDALRSLLRGTRRLAFGLTSVTDERWPWLLVLDQEAPDITIRALQDLAATKRIAFNEAGQAGERETMYTMQIPQEWIPGWIKALHSPGAMAPFRMFMEEEQVTPFTEPMYLTVWGGRYLILGARENDVKDAVEFYRFPDDVDFTLDSIRPFHDAREEARAGSVDQASGLFVFWNIAATLRQIDLRPEKPSGGFWGWSPSSSRGGLVDTLADFRQFHYLTYFSRFQSDEGMVRFHARLHFFNRPGWLDLVDFKARTTPLAEFCPRAPAAFIAASVDTPASAFDRLSALVREKSEALARPELWKQFQARLDEFAKEQEFPMRDLLALLGSQQAIFLPSPYDRFGNSNERLSLCAILSLNDVEKAERFIRDTLPNAPVFRKMFHHTSDREFMTFPGGRRVGYTVFNAMARDAFAFCVLEGCLLLGTQDAVRAAITARVTGENVSKDARYKDFVERAGLPGTSVLSAYGDFGFLAEHAPRIFGGKPPRNPLLEWQEFMQARQGAFFFDGRNPPVPQANKDVGELLVSLFQKYMTGYRVGLTLDIDGDVVKLDGAHMGLPKREDFTEMARLISNHFNWRQAREHLRDELAPALYDYLFTHGDLPANIEAFAARGGKRAAFRDPVQAGRGVRTPTDAQCFIWLGSYEGRDILPAVPLAHSREPDAGGFFYLLMSDASVHLVDRAGIDRAVKAARDGTPPPYRSTEAQTVEDLVALGPSGESKTTESGSRRRR